MQPLESLRSRLRRIDGRGYKAYRDLRGVYDFPSFSLSIDYVQGDPFAAPSRLSVRLSKENSGLPGWCSSNRIRRVAGGDFLTRSFFQAARRIARGRRGTGKSGLIEIDCGGQEVLERTSALVDADSIEVRFVAGLPAAGRRVLARQAEEMLVGEVPRIVEAALLFKNFDQAAFRRHVETVEDQQALRDQLRELGLAAFVADGAILPRRSGVDDRPLPSRDAVAFVSPESLRLALSRPNAGPIQGMGIPEGVTLIVGGGFHGKSTLLRALERGVYNHVPGDGREWVVAAESAVKIRAEDGRFVEGVDISAFIANLPFARQTDSFSTQNASGSTSQAANIIEALEMGSRLLLIDEDTSATNFMIRDARMQALVNKAIEPITPLVDRVRELHREHGASTILVMGGSGDYLEVADRVILMRDYLPSDVTGEARKVVERLPSERVRETGPAFRGSFARRPLPGSFDPRRGRRDVKIDVKGVHSLLFGTTAIDMGSVEQLVDAAQTRLIGEAIRCYGARVADPETSLRDGIQTLLSAVEEKGLDCLSSFKVGNLALPRRFEIAAAVNRMRSLKVK